MGSIHKYQEGDEVELVRPIRQTFPYPVIVPKGEIGWISKKNSLPENSKRYTVVFFSDESRYQIGEIDPMVEIDVRSNYLKPVSEEE